MEGSSQIQAIVFDANVFGGNVEPNMTTIENWAEACERHDAELWIPEVVAWELAQRVVHECEQLARQIQTHNGKRRKWGFPQAAEPPLINELQVIRRIGRAGAIIVPLEGEAAVAAIRDQVLLRGAGSRKKDVKTGAADSAWIRSVIEHNNGESDGLILVSGDTRAIIATCQSLDVQVPEIASSLGEIRHLLDETVEATEQQRTSFVSSITHLFSQQGLSASDLTSIADLSRPHNWWSIDLGMSSDDNWEFQDSSLQVERVEFVGPIQYDAWSESTAGQVRIEVEVEEQYARQDRWGDSPEYRNFYYGAWIQGEIALFDGQEPTLESIELAEAEFGTNPESVYSQAI
ncbi:hypothetical protein ACFYO8_00050 [Micromonospora sp. NPDC005257]|uniref:hypothetical protein n=1 Tax=Micromonospora sp. NPDC005257 TaxID=3364230 RepID=UPI0036B0AAD7